MENTAAGLASSLRLCGTGTTGAALGTSSVSSTCLCSFSPVIATSASQSLGQRLAVAIGENASFAVVPGSNHACQLEQPVRPDRSSASSSRGPRHLSVVSRRRSANVSSSAHRAQTRIPIASSRPDEQLQACRAGKHRKQVAALSLTECQSCRLHRERCPQRVQRGPRARHSAAITTTATATTASEDRYRNPPPRLPRRTASVFLPESASPLRSRRLFACRSADASIPVADRRHDRATAILEKRA